MRPSPGSRSRTVTASSASSAAMSIDARAAAREVDPDEVEDLAAEPDGRRRQRIDGDLEREDHRAVRDPGGRAATAGPGVPSRVAGPSVARSPATSSPMRPRIALRVRPVRRDEVGARQRAAAVQLADDRAQVRPTDGLAAVSELVATDQHEVCVPLSQMSVRDSYNHAAMSRRRLSRERGAMTARIALRIGILSTANIATGKVIPGMRRADRVRGRGDRVAGRASRPGPWPSASASRAPTVRTRRSSPTRTSTPSTSRCRTTSTPSGRSPRRGPASTSCARSRSRLTAADAERMIEAVRRGRRAADGGVHVSPPSVVGRRPRAGRGGPDRAAVARSRAGSRTSTTTRRTSATSARSAAARCTTSAATAVNLSRMLFGGEPTRVAGVDASATRRAASTSSRARSSTSTTASRAFTCSTRTETDQRVDIYGTTGRISIGIPFNIPPDRPTQVFVTAGGDPPVAPATEVLEFATADPYGVEAEVFAAAILDGLPTPVPPGGRGARTCG